MIRAGGTRAALCITVFVVLGCGADREVSVPKLSGSSALAEPRAASVAGELRVSLHAGSGGGTPLVHETEWVNGPEWWGLVTNDTRGFLDGRFIYGWNQPGQIHTRLGRRGSRPRWGETELFRTLMHWDGVLLPASAQVEAAEIQIDVEAGPERALDVLLYAVEKDWNPGQGGTDRDNTSPPLPGESWWNAAAEGERPWGFPGAGFASQTHPDADTPVTALAETRWQPGQASLLFRSEALARFVEERATAARPIGLLLKISDELEDTPDTVLYVYSGNQGDHRNPARRPRLRVRWRATPEGGGLGLALRLENGRSMLVPRLDARGMDMLAASFVPDSGSERPTLEARGARADGEVSDWQPAAHPVAIDWTWAEIRVQAARDPLPIGKAFETGFRDTWIRTAPPEEQVVHFTFESPRGEIHELDASYEGDWRWSLSFVPDELGRWRYHWTSKFIKHPYRSADAFFDVVPGDLDRVQVALDALLDRLRRDYPEGSDSDVHPLSPPFWKLERAVYQLATPEHMQSDPGRMLYDRMTEIRRLLSGRSVPDEVKPVPMRRDF